MSVDKTQQSRTETREELAETLQALARKTDVKSRARASAQQKLQQAREHVDQRVVLIGAAAAAVLVGLLVLRRSRQE